MRNTCLPVDALVAIRCLDDEDVGRCGVFPQHQRVGERLERGFVVINVLFEKAS